MLSIHANTAKDFFAVLTVHAARQRIFTRQRAYPNRTRSATPLHSSAPLLHSSTANLFSFCSPAAPLLHRRPASSHPHTRRLRIEPRDFRPWRPQAPWPRRAWPRHDSQPPPPPQRRPRLAATAASSPAAPPLHRRPCIAAPAVPPLPRRPCIAAPAASPLHCRPYRAATSLAVPRPRSSRCPPPELPAILPVTGPLSSSGAAR